MRIQKSFCLFLVTALIPIKAPAHFETTAYYAFLPALSANDVVIIEGTNGPEAQKIQFSLISPRGVEAHVLNQTVPARGTFMAKWTSGQAQEYMVAGLGIAQLRGARWTVMVQQNQKLSAIMDQRVFTGDSESDHGPGMEAGHEPVAITDLKSFPSPAQGTAQVAYAVRGEVTNITLEVWSSAGHLVKTTRVPTISTTGRGIFSVDVSDLGTGVYLMRAVVFGEGDEKVQMQRPLAVIGGSK